ncbi:MAG: InlB B-repeat-containing protein [Atribacterota bacterium]|nr:InlB B-repeat-containing protein [Atribacterota bacterium]
MKLSFKIILPIILISALLILLNGCFGVPADESPGYTPGTITGIIAAPCCSTSAELVSETCCVSPEYWCFYCQKTWRLQNGIKVVLAYGEDKIATVFTNKNGEFTFTNVDPGKNYVVTAYCPDFADNRPLVKDVALKLIEGGSFDTNITDLVSTSLGLVVDFLVLYTDWGPEDISLDAVLADRPNFPNFPKFKKLVYEVRRVVENCEVNLLTDDEVQDALCRAAEEISKLTIGCGPGYTPGPGPGPTPGPCVDDVRPEIDQVEGVDQVLLNGSPVSSGSTLPPITVGTPIEFCVYATDPDNKLAQPLTYSISGSKDGNPFNFQMGAVNCVSGTPLAEEVGTYIVYVYVSDGCLTTPWGPITVNIVPTYTVTYDVNGGTGSQTDLLSPYYAGVTVIVLNKGTMALAKHTFTGWNTAENGSGTPYAPAATFPMPAANVTLYAQWAKLDPLMSPVDVVPGQEQIRINLRDVNNNMVPNLDNINDWYVELSVADSNATIVSVQYGGHNIGPWDFQIRVVNIPTGTLLRNVTVIYNGYGYPLILHQAY